MSLTKLKKRTIIIIKQFVHLNFKLEGENFMRISRGFVVGAVVLYLGTGTLFTAIGHLTSAGSKYSSGPQKEVTVPMIFEPVRFVIDKLF